MSRPVDLMEAGEWLLEHDDYLILTHRRPDGDTVGCAAALCRGKRRKAARAACAHMNSCKKRQLAVDSFLNERAADWYICRPPLL